MLVCDYRRRTCRTERRTGAEISNLHDTVKSLRTFRDKIVLLSGGGNSLMNSSFQCFFHTTITQLPADADRQRIELVKLKNHQTGAVFELPVDEVVINHGYERDTSLLENSELQIETTEDGRIAGTPSGETSVPGIYAAGDILQHEGKLNLIAGAFQDAANAVNKAKRFIQPDAGQAAMVSSHHEAFKQRNREMLKQMMGT